MAKIPVTDSELRELDAWLAEHVFGWTHLGLTRLGALIGHNPETGLPCDIPKWTEKDFAEVKREIERRGWSWELTCHNRNVISKCYEFQIIGSGYPCRELAVTEELAGCLALKAAIKSDY